MEVDNTAKPCMVCGGHPIVVRWKFRSKFKCYYHCECGHRTTDWHEDKIGENGEVAKSARDVAREAYNNGIFVRLGGCARRKNMV